MLRSKGGAREDSRFEKPDILTSICARTVNVHDIDGPKVQSTLIFYRECIIFETEKRDGRKWSSEIRDFCELKQEMCEKYKLYNFQDIYVSKI